MPIAKLLKEVRLGRMTNISFPCVTIEIRQVGKPRNIMSVREAVELLSMSWPVDDGEKLELARQKCLEALDGMTGVTEARAAFIEAAKEAGVFVDYQTRMNSPKLLSQDVKGDK